MKKTSHMLPIQFVPQVDVYYMPYSHHVNRDKSLREIREVVHKTYMAEGEKECNSRVLGDRAYEMYGPIGFCTNFFHSGWLKSSFLQKHFLRCGFDFHCEHRVPSYGSLKCERLESKNLAEMAFILFNREGPPEVYEGDGPLKRRDERTRSMSIHDIVRVHMPTGLSQSEQSKTAYGDLTGNDYYWMCDSSGWLDVTPLVFREIEGTRKPLEEQVRQQFINRLFDEDGAGRVPPANPLEPGDK